MAPALSLPRRPGWGCRSSTSRPTMCARQERIRPISAQPDGIVRAMNFMTGDTEEDTQPARAWLRGLRLHHWSKNLFVFVPLLLGHLYGGLSKLAASVAAFLLLGLLVSAGYLINDVADIERKSVV